MGNKNILITGAGGFLGRNLTEHLGAGKCAYSVFAAWHSDLDKLDTDIIKKDPSIRTCRVSGARPATGK